IEYLAISEGHGDAALALIKAGAETDKKNVDEHLAIDLAPDTKMVVPPLELGVGQAWLGQATDYLGMLPSALDSTERALLWTPKETLVVLQRCNDLGVTRLGA
ncbi:hypothetical protein MMC29_007746, partial [Sticta canariensis]|nr:hypothetical protein [Sticta canariensis]